MTTPDKRRSGSHAVRSSATSRNSSVIAPPPRAQLTGSTTTSTSAGQEAEGAHETGIVSSSSSNNKDGGGASRSSSRGGGGGGGGSGSSSSSRGKEVALQSQLKEKDERIAGLERELTVMETEFTRELDRLSLNESETASFWQRRHSALNQQYLRTDTELRLLRAEADVRDAERRELLDALDVLRRDLRARDDELAELRRHLSGMKQWVSASTRADQQASDEEFADAAAKLGNSLQNWVIMHFRKAKLDFSNSESSVLDELEQLVPMYEEIEPQAKLHLLQSIVSSILVEMVFDRYFVGLPDERSKQLRDTEEFLASVGSTEAVNQWRATTLTLLRKEAPVRLQEETAAVMNNVVSRVNRILDAITDSSPTDARDQALRALVSNSVELARLLVVQRAVFKVTMPRVLPHQRIVFEALSMEDIGGEEEERLAACEICCVTFPGITKFGDENGGHPQFRNIIAKAKVLCSPE